MEWIPRNQSYCIQRRCFFFFTRNIEEGQEMLWFCACTESCVGTHTYVRVCSEWILMCLKLLEISIVLKICPMKQAGKTHNSFGEFIFHVEIMTLNLLQSSHNIKIHMLIWYLFYLVIVVIITIVFLILYSQIHKKVDNVVLTCLNIFSWVTA